MTSEDMSELGAEAWDDPTPNPRRDWSEIANQLRERPGEWLRIFEHGPTSTANAIRQGDVKAVRPVDGFQVTTRNNVSHPRKTCSLYLRYVPPDMADQLARQERAEQMRKEVE